MPRKRKYELRRRAESQAETRRRIVEACVALHGSVGPARTQIAGIARLANVQRMTVYRHFPDEARLFEACRDHWLANAPPPDPATWARIADPVERMGGALNELYAYYSDNEPLLQNVLRDAARMPALQDVVASGLGQYLGEAGGVLARGWGVRGAARRRLVALVGLAVRFETWQGLTRDESLSTKDAADLMASLTLFAAERPPRSGTLPRRA